MPNFISENQIEQALVQKLQHLHGFDALDCYTEDPEDLHDGSGRANKRDVILVDRVKEAALRLNPDIPAKAIDDALEQLHDRRQTMSLVTANREIYNLLRDGIPVEFDNAQSQKQQERVRLIHFNEPKENRYLAVTQLWIKGERGFRRPDVLLYINTVKMYDKVQRLWKEQLKDLRGQISKSKNELGKVRLQKRLDYMRSVEMAVIVSEEADEEKKFAKQQLTIKPHRERMNFEGMDIDTLLNNTDIFKNVSQFNHYADTLLSQDKWRSGRTERRRAGAVRPLEEGQDDQ